MYELRDDEVKSNIKCPLCGEVMEIIPQMSSKWDKICCPKQTCGLRCFVKDISQLITKKDRFSQTDEALLLRRLEIKKLRSEKKELVDGMKKIILTKQVASVLQTPSDIMWSVSSTCMINIAKRTLKKLGIE